MLVSVCVSVCVCEREREIKAALFTKQDKETRYNSFFILSAKCYLETDPFPRSRTKALFGGIGVCRNWDETKKKSPKKYFIDNGCSGSVAQLME